MQNWLSCGTLLFLGVRSAAFQISNFSFCGLALTNIFTEISGNVQYPHKVSGHPREAYAKTAFSLGRYGYNFKATFMKFVLRVLFIRKNTLIFFQIFSFTGSAVKKHLNSIRTAERTLCK